MDNRPIGIFDSGVGGLTILKAIHKLLPQESTIYFADQSYLPYGNKTSNQIQKRTSLITKWFVSQDAKIIIVACNSATVAAIDTLRKHFDLPFVGVVPPVKPATKSTQSNEIIVLATQKTATSKKHKNLLTSFAKGKKVHVIPAPKLVEIVETGHINSKQGKEYLRTLIKKHSIGSPDAIVLGCTHYPFAKQIISSVFHGAKIFEPSKPVARQVKHTLDRSNLFSSKKNKQEKYVTTGNAKKFETIASKLLGKKVKAIKVKL